jgi:hypothetical protein
MSTITIYSDLESWVTGVADFITELATKAIAERGRFTFAFSGATRCDPSMHVWRRRATSTVSTGPGYRSFLGTSAVSRLTIR